MESKLLVQQHSVVLFSPAGAAFAQGHNGFLTSKDNVMDTRYFATSKYEIVKELLRSAGNGNALGIWSSALGNGMFLCFIKQVWRDEDEEDVVVILRDNELTGVELQTHVLYLHEIERVCSFSSAPDRMSSGKEPVERSKESDHCA